MMQIDDLQAGRELDALVAEKVMGWKRNGNIWEVGGTVLYFPKVDEWSPSTDIAAAWEVVEKLRMTITPNRAHPRARWIADIELKGSHDVWLAGAETAPLAICKAALIAVGECE